MPLRDTLSALREMILDEPSLPPLLDERRAILRTRFPGLTADEADDLAQIPADKLAVYTGTVFRGERNIILRLFPLTTALLGRAWEELYGKKLDALALTKAIHRSHPWRGFRTVDLVQSFANHLLSNQREALVHEPAIEHLLRFETVSLDVARKASKENSVPSAPTETALTSLTVDQLLARTCKVSDNCAFAVFAYDVIMVESYYYRSECKLPPVLEPQSLYAVASRNHRLRVAWTAVSRTLHDGLIQLGAGTETSVEELAAAFLSGAPEGKSEAELFRDFLAELIPLERAGALFL